MRNLQLNVIVLGAACLFWLAGQRLAGAAPAPAPEHESASLLTKDETKEVNVVLESMIAAGFPDTQKAKVYSGKLAVSATFDPAQSAPPLPSSASRTQMTIPNSNKITYGYVFEGLHFKLADGSWVISLMFHFKPRQGDSVNATDATEIPMGTLTTDAIAAHPFDAEKDAAGYLKKVAAPQREHAKAALNRLVPITMYLKLGADSLAPAAVLLHRAGWKDAAELTLAINEQRARNYWQLKPWTTPDGPFDPTGAYPGVQEEERAWKAAHAEFTPEAPAVALRRALFRWCRAQMMVLEPEGALFPLDVATAAAKAAVDPKDPQGNLPRLEALAAGAKLPVMVAPDASLATRLQSWEGRPRMPKMTVAGGNGGLGISTSFTAPPPAYTPQKADLDALIALLADERPSRFWDFSGARTVGDNAWRAVAILLKSDPRSLAGYATDKPWTAAERKAAAKAMQAWWKEHRKEYVEN